jgi:futalosine hydrolase
LNDVSCDILLLTATDREQSDLRARIQTTRTERVAGRVWTRGSLSGMRVCLVETGVGAVNTAHALTRAMESLHPGQVLQFGVGGAYLSSGMNPGDLALATEEVYGDLGVITKDGAFGMDFIGFPTLKKEREYYNRFALAGPVAEIKKRLTAFSWDEPTPVVQSGTFITVQQCSGMAGTGNRLAARFDGICENMEGAAAAHLCSLYDTLFLEIRSVSNRVEDRNFAAWNLPLAMRRAQQAALIALDCLAEEKR